MRGVGAAAAVADDEDEFAALVAVENEIGERLNLGLVDARQFMRDPVQKRITIDSGFASIDLGEDRLGIVDVPGHERFIKNMLAGATGIDLALLVVAADDSIMPQTREHLEILRLLGLKHGLVALTKCDLVDDTTREVVALEVRELVRGTFLADAPLLRRSAL